MIIWLYNIGKRRKIIFFCIMQHWNRLSQIPTWTIPCQKNLRTIKNSDNSSKFWKFRKIIFDFKRICSSEFLALTKNNVRPFLRFFSKKLPRNGSCGSRVRYVNIYSCLLQLCSLVVVFFCSKLIDIMFVWRARGWLACLEWQTYTWTGGKRTIHKRAKLGSLFFLHI